MTDSCVWESYQKLLNQIVQAKLTNNFTLLEQLKSRLNDLAVRCGAVTDEIEHSLSDYTNETLRQIPSMIQRCVTNENIQVAKDICIYAELLTRMAKKKQNIVQDQSISNFILGYPNVTYVKLKE